MNERKTARLRLRPLVQSDLGFFVRLQSDPRTTVHRPEGPSSLEDARADLETYLAIWARHGVGYWLVERAGEPIGVAGLRPATVAARACWNLFYRFVPEAWGHGYAVEAAREAVRVAESDPTPLPVIARTLAVNAPAIAVAERAGLSRRPELDAEGWIVLARGW